MDICFTRRPTEPIESLGIGVFDGFHVGHQAVAKHASHLLTFSRHPAEVIRHCVVNRLTTIAEMHVLYPHFIVMQFSSAVAALTWDDFLNQVKTKLDPKKIVVGYDFHFGAHKLGTTERLKEWGKTNGIAVQVVQPNSMDDVVIKSSTVRHELNSGNFARAIQFMGHPYIIRGNVIRGEGRGAKIGFPTANLHTSAHKSLPNPGVYSGRVRIQSALHDCLIYIGKKPTFHGEKLGTEVFIKNFSGNLYGKVLTVFVDRQVRGEMTFPNVEALVAQIQQDLMS